MVRTRLTSVGKLFGGLLVLFYIASVTSQSGLLLLFIGLIGCCFIVNWSFARRNVRSLRVFPPRLVELVEGESPKDPWRIENISRKHAENIDILHHAGTLFRLPIVKAKDAVTVVPTLVYERRGVFPHAEVTVTCAAPYGLMRASRKLQLEGEIVVLPRIYDTEAPASTGVDQVSGGRFRGNRRVSHGTNFAGVRPWMPGDALKNVHWKSTARRDELMVKTFEEELGGRVSLVLDCNAGDTVAVDNAVRSAASLAVAALQAGHHLELIDFSAEALRLAPFSDEGELLIRLARYQPGAATNLDLNMCWRNSTILLIGTKWKLNWTEWIEAARARKRRVSVYLPEGQNPPPDAGVDWAEFGRAHIRPMETAQA
jgi:uncharacterized protein (DUF58 family)